MRMEALPPRFQTEAVRPYAQALAQKRLYRTSKRVLDLCGAVLGLMVSLPLMAVLWILIRIDSPGPALFGQTRVTRYGRMFTIYKFRTMTIDHGGGDLTVGADRRVTRVGRRLRKLRLDEWPQLWNIVKGDMSFVGTRPEVPRYVASYSDEMWATLLMPAGMTSEASLRFRDEADRLAGAQDPDVTYIEEVLPQKMAINLEALARASLKNDLLTALRSLLVVIGR